MSSVDPINNPEVKPSDSLAWNHAFDLALQEYPLEPTLASLIVSEYDGERDEKDRMSGTGTALFANGDKYDGTFLKGMMHGEGLYTWSDGTLFSGSFVYNEIIGTGKYTWPDGSIYEGDVYKGKRNGKGTFCFPASFPRYIGNWTDGKRNGFGRLDYILPSSTVSSKATTNGKKEKDNNDKHGIETINNNIPECYYEGGWANDARSGKGIMKYVSGNLYEGDWKNDKKEGKGIMNWYNRKERYSGEWKNDVQNGYGEHIWIQSATQADPSVKVPPKKEGAVNELTTGILKQMCNMYRGSFQGGKRNGVGQFFYSNGSRYCGYWSENEKHGPGIFISDQGLINVAIFKFNKTVSFNSSEKLDEVPESTTATTAKRPKSSSNSPTSKSNKSPPRKAKGGNEEQQKQSPKKRIITNTNSRINISTLNLNLDVSDILPARKCEVTIENQKIVKLLVQHNTDLRKIYNYYLSFVKDRSTDNIEKASTDGGYLFTLTTQDFKELLSACNILDNKTLTSAEVDMILKQMRRHHNLLLNSTLRQITSKLNAEMTNENNLPLIANIGEQAESIGDDLSKTLLFREFLEALVRIAHFMNVKTAHMVSSDLFSLSKWFIEQKIIAYFRAIVDQKSQIDVNIATKESAEGKTAGVSFESFPLSVSNICKKDLLGVLLNTESIPSEKKEKDLYSTFLPSDHDWTSLHEPLGKYELQGQLDTIKQRFLS